MNKDDFINFLNQWLAELNEYNSNSQLEDKLILDTRYFDLSEDGKYSVNSNGVNILLEADFCIVGDNPGKNEKDPHMFFYFDANKDDRRRAGSKAQKLTNKLDEKSIVFFNKCLISTNRTNDLKQKQIMNSLHYVIEFINALGRANKKIKFVFLGVNKKFKKIFERIELDEDKAVLYYHFCSSKYNESNLIDILDGKNDKALNFDDYDFYIIQTNEDDDDNGDGDSSLPVLA